MTKYIVIAGICALLLAVYIGYSLKESVNVVTSDGQPTVKTREAIKETVVHDSYVDVGTQPITIVVTPVEGTREIIRQDGTVVKIVSDTIRVAVPRALAADTSGVRITRLNPVTVRRPVFGDPTVTLASYNPQTQSYEDLTYEVPESPVKYGLSFELFASTPFERGSAPALGGSAKVYVGYNAVQPFVSVDYSRGGLEYRGGVRYRIGR